MGSGLLSTFTPETTTGQWIGYQIITTLGRGMAFQVVRVISSYHQLMGLRAN